MKAIFFRKSCYFQTTALVTALILLLLTGCGAESPEGTAEAFLAAWSDGDYEAMYELLNAPSRESYDQAYFTGRYSGIAGRMGLLSVESALGEEMDSSGEMVTYSFETIIDTYTVGSIPVSNRINLTREDRRSPWLVEWHPGLIFPDLTGERRVGLARIEPTRGSILDRHRRPLAEMGTFYEIGAVPGWYDDEEDFIITLSEVLEMSPGTIESRLNQPWVREGLHVPLKVIGPDEEELLALLEDIPGVNRKPVKRRHYPEGTLLAHTLGYLAEISAAELELLLERGYRAGDITGRVGLEAALEEILAGSFGFTLQILEADGAAVTVLGSREVAHGEDVVLTIDLDLQRAAEAELEGKRGAVVVLEPATGELLALASNPTFDPNLFVGGIAEDQWRALQDNPHMPLLNRALSGLYPPGSAFKPFTAATAVEEERLDPEKRIRIEGESWQPSEAWGGYKVKRVFTEQVDLDLNEAMKYSDNIYFARAGLALGSTLFEDYGEKFGFGETVPFTLPVATSRLSQSGVETEILLADSSFGQGEIRITPLHMALIYCSITGHGNMPLPRLLHDSETGLWKGSLISAETAAIVHNSLVKTINDPGAPAGNGKIEGFIVAGKTGTAETDAVEGNICWYVTYGPAEDPRAIVVVAIEGGGWASADALPIGRAIMEYYLKNVME